MAGIPVTLERRPAAPAPAGGALWALGFRPFYLLAAALAVLSVPLWALQFAGALDHAWLRGAAWHAHEMVFGFALAVIVGFLFTAGRNWSGQPTPSGRALQALVALWLAARVLVLSPWGLAAALANVAFPLAAAWGLWRALHAGGNRRNYFFVGVLLLFAVGAALFHGLQLVPGHGPQVPVLPVALDLVLFVIAVMGGRVIPMFSNNGVPGMQATRHARVEPLALGGLIALAVADLAGLPPAPAAALLLALLAVHGRRWWLWQPWRSVANPLVWVLHLAYAWLLLHLALRAGAALGGLPAGPATHALTVGTIGTITLGMMTRTALGHTGRPLRAGRAEVAAYALVSAAALVRVFVPLLVPAALVSATLTAAALWSAAFAVYLIRYAPWLWHARADGQPG